VNRRTIKILYIFGFIICSINLCWTQIQVVDGLTAPYDATNLIENVFLGDGVELINVTHSGTDRAIGYFSNGMADINLDRGIIMSTGYSEDAMLFNQTSFESSGFTSGSSVSDPQLESISSVDLFDQNIYEITFVPISDTLRFRYVFASEEYKYYVCNSYNDVFGFFIDGPKPASQGGGNYNWENIARIPDPADPSGKTFLNLPVSINTVNHGSLGGSVTGAPAANCDLTNDIYFNEVANGGLPVYNGYLDIFIAEAIVIPCQEYTIKLAIGDGEDDIFDSAVFLEAKSFGAPSLDLVIDTESLDGGVAEGCQSATFTFTSPIDLSTNLDLDFNILTAGLSLPLAENGIDYSLLPNDLEIPAGQSAVSFDLIVLEDGIAEGEEFFVFDYQKDICTRDTIYIRIVENQLESPVLPDDMSICRGEEQLLDAEFPPSFTLPDPPIYNNTQELLINQANIEFYSDITVTGMVPEFLNENVIKQICIDSLTHITLYDLDIYLITPGGQILELSTDNGWRGPDPDIVGLNFMQDDYFVNTCFSIDAARVINNGDPIKGDIFSDTDTYTGSFLPEGVWDDLWDGENPTNGTYRLLVIDDDPGFNTGVLSSWSICFSSVYEINFEWSADPPGSLSCIDCQDPIATPDVTTTYYLTTRDSYGCEEIDSVIVTVLDTPSELENLICNETAIGELTFSWDADPFASSYEISLDGGITWIDVGTDLLYVIGSLSMTEIVDFWVRGKNVQCIGDTGSLLCSIGNCEIPVVTITSLTDVSCVGFLDGSFTIEATGTTGPYTYTLDSEVNQTGVFNNLPSGDYAVMITDDLDCTSVFNVSIESADPIVADFIVINPLSCFGDGDGQLTLEVVNGEGPFSFNWSNGQTDSIAINLMADNYLVTVTDANNCEQIFNADFDQPGDLIITPIEASSVSCAGLLDGIATLDIVGGTAPFVFLWEDGTTEDSLFNVGVGNYLIVVTDANMCTGFTEVTITEPDPLVANLSFSNPACFDSFDGMIMSDPTGGTGPYTFVWSTGAQTGTIENLTGDTYQLTVTDANLCMVVMAQQLDTPDEINLGFNISQISCFGSATGAIDINATGGDNNFTYAWQGTNSGQTFQTKNINSLIADEYCVTITDGNMCTSSLCAALNEPQEITVVEIIQDASCNGGTDGSIDLMIEGGNDPYVVVWTGAISPNNEDLIDLSAGTYSVQITDSNNCGYSETFVVAEASDLIVQESIVDVLCKNELTGSIDLTIEGGNDPYLVSWSGPGNFISNNPSISDLEDGSYVVTVSDQNGCTFISAFEVEEPDEGLILTLENDFVCQGIEGGVLTVAVDGGVFPYSYLWSNGAITSEIENISAGNYSVTVTDANDCSSTASADVTDFEDLEIFTSSLPASCFAINDGSASVDSVKVNGVLLDLDQLQYTWNTSPIQNGKQIFNLSGDQVYEVTVTDLNQCASVSSVMVTQPPILQIELVQKEDPICYNGKEGFIRVTASGGTPTYDYSWSLNTGSQTDSLAQGLGADSYIVEVTDFNNCSVSETFNLDEPTEIITDFLVTKVSCFGFNDGTVDLQLSGGFSPYNLNWSTGDTTSFVTDLSAGLYYVTIVDDNLCEMVDSVLINQNLDPLSFTFDAEDVSCFGGFDGRITIFPEGGSGLYLYSLDGIDYTSTPAFIGLVADVYSVYVKDQNDCVSIIENIEITQNPELVINIGTSKEVAYGESIQLFPEILNGQGVLTYSWSSSDIDLFNCDNCSFPTIENITTDIFTTLTVVDENGCQAEVQIRIIAVLEIFVDIPTGFTPDGDGVNDILNVFGKGGILVKEFNIYDRWGEKVYSEIDFNTNDLSIGWDGSFKGEAMNPGVFIWTAEVENVDGSVYFFKGSTTLIR